MDSDISLLNVHAQHFIDFLFRQLRVSAEAIITPPLPWQPATQIMACWFFLTLLPPLKIVLIDRRAWSSSVPVFFSFYLIPVLFPQTRRFSFVTLYV